jgi:hypothetical protein
MGKTIERFDVSAAAGHWQRAPKATSCCVAGGRSEQGASPRSRKSAEAIHRREFVTRDP